MERTGWEGQNFSEVVAPQEEEDTLIAMLMQCNNKTSNVHINVTLACVHVTIVAMKKTSITYSECVFVAIGI
jgi:hypothetical protein